MIINETIERECCQSQDMIKIDDEGVLFECVYCKKKYRIRIPDLGTCYGNPYFIPLDSTPE